MQARGLAFELDGPEVTLAPEHVLVRSEDKGCRCRHTRHRDRFNVIACHVSARLHGLRCVAVRSNLLEDLSSGSKLRERALLVTMSTVGFRETHAGQRGLLRGADIGPSMYCLLKVPARCHAVSFRQANPC